MKWMIEKSERFSLKTYGINAKKNNNKFLIDSYSGNSYRKHCGWYITVKNSTAQKVFNSLWKNIYFSDIEEAKRWCEDFTWDIEEKEDGE
jgi:hypothetical protein